MTLKCGPAFSACVFEGLALCNMLLVAFVYNLSLACGPFKFQLSQASNASLVAVKLHYPCVPSHIVSLVPIKC